MNKIVDLVKKTKKCLIFKVDFEKVYNYVSWSFLYYMLGRLDFCDKWHFRIRVCVLSGSLFVLVKGFPT